jgi:frataxin-like iron-binding protein CyaY
MKKSQNTSIWLTKMVLGAQYVTLQNSNWMKKSQNTSIWLTKIISGAQYVTLQIKIG